MLVVALAFITFMVVVDGHGGGEEPQREETKLPITFVLSRQPHATRIHSINSCHIIINNGDDAEKSKYCMPVGVALMQQ